MYDEDYITALIIKSNQIRSRRRKRKIEREKSSFARHQLHVIICTTTIFSYQQQQLQLHTTTSKKKKKGKVICDLLLYICSLVCSLAFHIFRFCCRCCRLHCCALLLQFSSISFFLIYSSSFSAFVRRRLLCCHLIFKLEKKNTNSQFQPKQH